MCGCQTPPVSQFDGVALDKEIAEQQKSTFEKFMDWMEEKPGGRFPRWSIFLVLSIIAIAAITFAFVGERRSGKPGPAIPPLR